MALDQIETIITLVCLPLGIVLAGLGFRALGRPGRIAQRAVHTSARITEIYTTRYKSNLTYHCGLEFAAEDGQPVRCKVETRMPGYRAGEEIPIYYLAHRPERVYLEGDRTYILYAVWVLLGVCVLGFGLLPLVV